MKLINYLPKTIRGKLVRSRLPELKKQIPGVFFEIADTDAKKESCTKLVRDVYEGVGYSGDSGANTVEYDLAATFHGAIFYGCETVITASIFIDNTHLGLPISTAFPFEVFRLRTGGRRVVEVGRLAARDYAVHGDKSIPIFLDKILVLYCKDVLRADSLVITTHPKYRHIYEDIFLFDKIGYVKEFGYANGNPAVAMHMDLRTLKERLLDVYGSKPGRGNIYDFFFGDDLK